jgi:hypothetical protein
VLARPRRLPLALVPAWALMPPAQARAQAWAPVPLAAQA